ncbi:MAG: homoserine dehydrogenase [Lachnospiraceae bacterium]|nr:homoserine dehydrogenase [Lachnospiraceae bacterium]
MIKAAIMGYGTVGSGVYEVLTSNAGVIAERVGEEIEVKYVLDLREFPGDPVEKVLVHDVNVIMDDPEIKVVVEVMGGLKPAYDFVKTALLKGKSVATSNKELVAKHGAELIELAKANKASFLFEASVGGGIPIIRPLLTSVTADHIVEISGILNGTTNYILTAMSEEGADYDTVLKQAQDLGYAERNPEADVEGYDACRKIAILTSLALGKQVDFEDIYTEGITAIDGSDIAYAKALGGRIKLLGLSRMDGDRVCSMVAPFMVPADQPLYAVNGVFNGIFVKGNMVGDLMFYGSGAGKLPTASAVVGDVVEAAKTLGTTVPIEWSKEKVELTPMKEFTCRFFVRVKEDEQAVKKVFGNIEPVSAEGVTGEFAFLTEEMSEGDFDEKIKGLSLIHRIRSYF